MDVASCSLKLLSNAHLRVALIHFWLFQDCFRGLSAFIRPLPPPLYLASTGDCVAACSARVFLLSLSYGEIQFSSGNLLRGVSDRGASKLRGRSFSVCHQLTIESCSEDLGCTYTARTRQNCFFRGTTQSLCSEALLLLGSLLEASSVLPPTAGHRSCNVHTAHTSRKSRVQQSRSTKKHVFCWSHNKSFRQLQDRGVQTSAPLCLSSGSPVVSLSHLRLLVCVCLFLLTRFYVCS